MDYGTSEVIRFVREEEVGTLQSIPNPTFWVFFKKKLDNTYYGVLSGMNISMMPLITTERGS